MKHIKISVIVLVLSLCASLSFGAQSAVTSIGALGTSAKLGDLRGAINTKLGTVESNRQDHESRVAALEALVGDRPWVVQANAPADTSLAWFDTDQIADAFVLKIHNGTAWVQQAIGEGGAYTLPTATSDMLGGIKVGSRLTITNGVLSADVQSTDISGKQDVLVSGTTIKTINGSSILGSGNLSIGEGGGISHATSDDNYYASRNGTWASLAGVYAVKSALAASINSGVPNGTGALVHWSQLTGVPAGFADNSDDGSGGGDMVYPGAGVPLSTGSAWGTSYSVGTGANNLVQLNASSQLPAVSAALLTNFPTLNQSTTGNAATATALQTARTIGGVSFDGTANINLPGVNTTGNQNTTGSAATLTTARTIGGVSFNGSANINLPGVNTSGNQNTTGTAAGLSAQYIDWNSSSGGSSIANKPTLGTASALNYGTAIGNLVRIVDDGSGGPALPFSIDLMDMVSGGTAINPPSSNGYVPTFSTSGVITWAPMSGGLASTDIDTSAELRAILTDEVGTGAAYFVGGALGTPASATLTNATGLPVSGITNSTTAALGLGSIELGHASDTTLSRSAAGVLAVEGVVVPTISSADTLTNKKYTGPTYTSIVSTTTATGNINLDGVSASNYEYSNGSTDATYTPVFTSRPSAGNVRYITLTVGGGSGVDTMNWTNVTWMGTEGAAATTTNKKSSYACIVDSATTRCKIIAEAY